MIIWPRQCPAYTLPVVLPLQLPDDYCGRGEGAIAAQAINRAMFEESLETHSLKQVRARQFETSDRPVTF